MTDEDYRRRTLAVLVGGLLFLIVVVLVATASYLAGANSGQAELQRLEQRVFRLETDLSIVSEHVAQLRE